jgi:membrane-associated phospholipid phosphatase
MNRSMYRLIRTFCAAVAVIGAAIAVIGLIFFIDEPAGRHVDRWIPRDLQQLSARFSNYGTYLFYMVFAGLFGYARLTQNRLIDQHCRAYLKAQLVFSFALVRALKIIIGRMRPGGGPAFNFFSLESKYNSFPSGHASDIFVGAVLLFILLRHSRWRQWRFVPLLYAVAVAVGRITGGWHYVADVAAGAIIGICGALFFLSRLPAHPESTLQADQS